MRKSIIRRIGVLAGTVTVAATGFAAAASAAPSGPATGTATAVVQVSMTLDCTHLTPAAQRYAAAHHYCSTTSSTGAVTPDNREPGECGTSYLFVDNLGGGNARFRWGFSSSGGTVVLRSLNVSWDNTRWQNEGSWPDVSAMLSSTYDAQPKTVSTGSGPVTGVLSGWVLLWWGGTCDILNPWDVKTIT